MPPGWRAKRKQWKRDDVVPNLKGRIDEGDDGVWRFGLRSGLSSVLRSQVQGWHTEQEATRMFTALFPGVPFDCRYTRSRLWLVTKTAS